MNLSNAGPVGARGASRSLPSRRSGGPRSLQAALAALTTLLLVVGLNVVVVPAAAAAVCTGNAVVCENQLPGNDRSEWDIDGAGDDSIQGFATQMSVNHGEKIDFKIKTDAASYTIKIYRLGYYQGKGARKIADVTPSVSLPQNQPACVTDATTEIYDCGTWGVSASWVVPSTAVSGVYIALLERPDNGGVSHITFIVRSDGSTSAIVYQTSDTTWQAYNTYGGSSFYVGQGNGRAYKLSYNRPFATRSWENGRDFLFSNEVPMIRFLESNGYDVSYISGLDTDIRGGQLTNHKTFLSVGHDEYWSAGQRTNVEAARDAGVNLAFFSGNEVYWKTRWEPSQDGSNTPNRTLVCYKDTWANSQIDPAGPTATWRDPRFGDNGHGPENALTGTAYVSNISTVPITVSADEGNLRIWRNTGLNQPANGVSTQLQPLGYESDEDLDNGYRPAGLIRLSTGTGPVPDYLQDFGNVVAPGTTTHHLTMYRAGSGSLVFSAGTVQWSWGLDVNHDGTQLPVDTRMQQATVNILADMTALPSTLSTPGIVASSKSTDSTPPTAVITAPVNGSAVSQGSTVTVTGTATDTGGGVVGGVEVSLDGGSTWHPADGRNSFTYTGVVTGTGSSVIRARAIDDSGNIQSPAANVSSNVQCPCSIFGGVTPKTVDSTDSSAVTLGVKFTSSSDGFITGIRYFKSAANTGTHTGALYQSNGALLSSVTFANETASGWQVASFPRAVPIAAGVTYVAAYRAPTGHYSADTQFFAYRGATGGPLTALGGYANPNGVYTFGNGMPDLTYKQTNYYVDALYSPTDTTPLTVASYTPVNGVSSVPVGSKVSATFSRPPTTGSIQFTIADPSGQVLPAELAYDAGSMTATLTPSGPLEPNTNYQVALTASSPDVGAMSQPATWTFRTAKADGINGVCPCTLFNDSDAPTVSAAGDPNSVELGVAFSSDVDGQISGVRFYKGIGNDGPHSVSLWSAAGAQLATASVGQESTAGWQEASFAAPVAVVAGTSYIASYRAPVGHYAFSADGLAAPIDRAPLHTASNGGRYTYGSGAPLNQYSANYYIDPVFTVSSSSAPYVSSVSPVDQSSSIPVSTSVVVNFNTAVQPGSASIVVADPSGAPVQGTLSNQATGSVATFAPSSLTPGTKYTITVSGAKNLGGAPMASPAISTFTTAGIAGCPCSVLASSATPAIADSTDQAAITVGLQFQADTNGYMTGLRYYRDAANTGSHTGSLYTAGGTLLGTLTYSDTGTGWQTATFASPIPITAGTTYVASTYMPNGHYSFTPSFFGSPYVNPPLTGLTGVYSYGGDVFPSSSYNGGNYFVDVEFSGQDPASATVPESPTNVSAIAENGSAVVSWNSPANGGSPITSYSVTPWTGSSALTPTIVSGSNPATSATVGGLSNGTPYTFTVTASNAKGAGAQSSPSPAVTPAATVPGAPVGVTAVVGDGQATVSWSAPVSDGGSSITGYTVTPFLMGAPQQSTDVGTTSLVVPNLSNGSAYTFKVVAKNVIGTGPESAASAPVTPVGVPGAPTGVTASAGNATASISWIAPASTGGSPITGYVVTPFLDGVAQPATTVTGNPPATSVAINGLTNGSPYTFSVSASNSVGQGITSGPSSAVTPATNPGAPTGVNAAAGNAMATVSWTAPVSNGGSPITSYVVTPYIGGSPQATKTVSGAPPSTSVVVDGLTNGVSYTFTVTAANAVGSSLSSSPSAAVSPALPTAPGIPTNVAASPGNASATVSWSAPADGGSAITSYTVTPYIGTTAQTTRAVQVSAPATVANITSLTNGTSYTFQVKATNAVGTGSPGSSTPVTPASTPNAPTITGATSGNASVALAWSTPANGGSVITGYVVTPYVGPVAQASKNVTSSPATISGLTNGTTYTFKVAAVNAMGTGVQSSSSSAVTPATVPGAPSNVAGIAGSGSVVLSWSAPTSDGGSTITAYSITRYVNNVAQGSPVSAGSGTSFTVTGLTNGTTYTFSVTATNSKGTGAASAQSAGIKPFVPAFVQQQSARSSSTNAITATPTNNIVLNNRLVVMVGVKNGSAASAQSVGDAAGNIYTKIGAARAADQTEMSIWTAPVSAGGGTRPIITARSTVSAVMSIAVMEYSGLSVGSDAVEQVKFNSGSLSGFGTAQSNSTDVGTSAAAEMALGFYLDGGANRLIFAGSGFTQRVNGSPNSSLEFFAQDQVTGAASTKYNSTFTVSGSVSGYVAATVVLKRAA